MNMKVACVLSFLVVLASGTSACSRGATRGGLIGGAGGAVVGSATGLGTTEGAVVGGTAGTIIGDKDKHHRHR
ncbi:MAG: hypothetical protein QM681_05560 [Novosphingobium sp.]